MYCYAFASIMSIILVGNKAGKIPFINIILPALWHSLAIVVVRRPMRRRVLSEKPEKLWRYLVGILPCFAKFKPDKEGKTD